MSQIFNSDDEVFDMIKIKEIDEHENKNLTEEEKKIAKNFLI